VYQGASVRSGVARSCARLRSSLRSFAQARNTIERRYLQNVKYVKNAAADAERQKLAAVGKIFKKYGAKYKVDYLLMAAQGYQESTLDQNVKSPVGAVGVMQVMPPTGKELNVGNISEVEPNIHAGVKYMRFMMDQYFRDEPMDDLNKMLMTFAAYNAGPGRLRQLRRETEKRGLDPNLWATCRSMTAAARLPRSPSGSSPSSGRAYRLGASGLRSS
jgi:membrane-bound lytic murein transglycosylase MltF